MTDVRGGSPSSPSARRSNPCASLRLFDVEVDARGTPKGAWLADLSETPTLVLIGTRLGDKTLARVTSDAAGQASAVWFDTPLGPCTLSVPSELPRQANIEKASAPATDVVDAASPYERTELEPDGSATRQKNPDRTGARGDVFRD